MLWYISVCSTIGGISVSVTTGLGAAIVSSIMGNNQASCCHSFNVQYLMILQFTHWFIYFLMVFVVITLRASLICLHFAILR